MPRIGETAPDFTQESTEGTIDFHAWIGESWCVLFSHPKDFTPVCTTELGEVARLGDEFAKRNVKRIALSVDPVDDHKGWIKDIEETQNAKVDYPIVADPDRKVSDLYDMIHPDASDSMTVRSVFIIDPDKKIRLILTYPASCGRDFREILRTLDSLQLTDHHSVATPVNWRHGERVIIAPAVSDDEAKEKFPGYEAVKPYLRYTEQPS